eukprot:9565686-Lingulodinium_polyedra.AAC.1
MDELRADVHEARAHRHCQGISVILLDGASHLGHGKYHGWQYRGQCRWGGRIQQEVVILRLQLLL